MYDTYILFVVNKFVEVHVCHLSLLWLLKVCILSSKLVQIRVSFTFDWRNIWNRCTWSALWRVRCLRFFSLATEWWTIQLRSRVIILLLLERELALELFPRLIIGLATLTIEPARATVPHSTISLQCLSPPYRLSCTGCRSWCGKVWLSSLKVLLLLLDIFETRFESVDHQIWFSELIS